MLLLKPWSGLKLTVVTGNISTNYSGLCISPGVMYAFQMKAPSGRLEPLQSSGSPVIVRRTQHLLTFCRMHRETLSLPHRALQCKTGAELRHPAKGGAMRKDELRSLDKMCADLGASVRLCL